MQRAFYAEQREELWYSDGKHLEDIVRITRLPNRSFLAIHPLHPDEDRFATTRDYYFYLNDTQTHIQYAGQTDLGVAWPQYNLPSSIPGRDQMVDQYGD